MNGFDVIFVFFDLYFFEDIEFEEIFILKCYFYENWGCRLFNKLYSILIF